MEDKKVSPVGGIAGAVADIFGNVTKIITSAPRRIGKSISRDNTYHLRTNNSDVLAYLTSTNMNKGAGQFVYNADNNKKSIDTNIILILIIAVIIGIFIYKSK